MRHAQLNHFTGAHKQNIGFFDVFKNTPCQAHRGRGHADGVRANFRGASDFLGHCKGALKQLVERGAQGTRVAGRAHGFFELSQNLRLAQDHRVEAAGNSKRMPRRCIAFKSVGVPRQNINLCFAGICQPTQCLGYLNLITCTVNFCSIASGQNRHFFVCCKTLAQTFQRLIQALRGKRKALAQINRRSFVVQP